MTADLRAYVGIETPSNDKELLRAGLSWIERYLTDSLGPAGLRRVVDGGDHGDMLEVEYPGVGPRRVLVLCHYDTVWDRGTLETFPCTVSDGVMRGPGVFDMKAGLIQAVWALRALDTSGLPRPTVRFLCTGDEELGSVASRATIHEVAADVEAVLVMEPGVDGAIKTARKGVGMFTIQTHGVEAHTGLDPLAGASAIDEMAKIVLKLRRLQDLDAGTNVNVGTLHGGRRSNVVAGHASATLDVRVDRGSEAARVDRALAELTPEDPRVRVEIGGGWNRPVMERTPAIGQMFELAAALADSMGEKLLESAAGGGSDANFLAVENMPLLDGLGAFGAGAHSRQEHVVLDPTWQRVELVAALMAAFGTEAEAE